MIHKTKKHIFFQVPGDKSISHRAIMLGSLAEGITEVEGFLPSLDCYSTISCFRKLGVKIECLSEHRLRIYGQGIQNLQRPFQSLNVGNSGTTIRLLLGILACASFPSTVFGDRSIAKRPMDRVVFPLQKMGAIIKGEENDRYTPLHIQGTRLQGITYQMPVASAQVKSCILLAGLYAAGKTQVIELTPSRNHTELMLSQFGVSLKYDSERVTIEGGQQLLSSKIIVPGDISSAAFLLSAAMIVPGLAITVNNVGLNPTRIGILDVFRMMGARVYVEKNDLWGNEPVGHVTVVADELQGVQISGNLIPRLIDEIPILAVIATQARGETIISDAGELKVKESNRIAAIVHVLKRLGATIEERADGIRIVGRTPLKGGVCTSYGDHRIAMSLCVAGLISKDPIQVLGKESINVSFPGFEQKLQRVTTYLS